MSPANARPAPAVPEREPASVPASALHLDARMLDAGGAALLAVIHAPVRDRPRGPLVILPPWGEEENRSRALLAALARRLAAEGIAAALLNLSGTGESWPSVPPADPRQWAAELADAAAALCGLTGAAGPPALLACRRMAGIVRERVLALLPPGRFRPVLLWDPIAAVPAPAEPLAPPVWAHGPAASPRTGRARILRSPDGAGRVWTAREGRVDTALVATMAARIAARLGAKAGP